VRRLLLLLPLLLLELVVLMLGLTLRRESFEFLLSVFDAGWLPLSLIAGGSSGSTVVDDGFA